MSEEDFGDDDLTGIYGEGGLDTQNNEGMGSFDPLPAGEYLAIATNAGVKDTKDGTGKYMKVEFEVLEPEEQNGRKVWAQINLQNRNPKASEIGQRELVSFGRAVGVMNVQRPSDLVNKPLVIKLKIVNDKEYGPKNEISGYFPVDGDAVPAPQQTAPQAPAAAPAPVAQQPAQAPAAPRQTPPAQTGGKLPWQRK